jgi:hypothetical protein
LEPVINSLKFIRIGFHHLQLKEVHQILVWYYTEGSTNNIEHIAL